MNYNKRFFYGKINKIVLCNFRVQSVPYYQAVLILLLCIQDTLSSRVLSLATVKFAV